MNGPSAGVRSTPDVLQIDGLGGYSCTSRPSACRELRDALCRAKC
jgi:hypothetical protein